MRVLLLVLASLLAFGLADGTAGAATTPTPPHIDFGSIPIETHVDKTVTIALDAGFSFDSFDGSGTTFPFAFHSDCFAKTGPADCHVEETFGPDEPGTQVGETDIQECRVVLFFKFCQTIPVTMTGNAFSIASAKPSLIEFGSVPIETQVTKTATITVDNGYVIPSNAIHGSGTTFPFSFHTTCLDFRGPGHCTLDETFFPVNPQQWVGLTMVDECPMRGGTCVPINVSETGRGVSTLNVRPSFIGFGFIKLGKTARKTARITVDSAWRLVPNIAGGGDVAPYHVDLGRCLNFIGPGTCKITETYRPVSQGLIVTNLQLLECPQRGGTCTPINIGIGGRGI
jgi:hypothetical protein